MSDKYVVLFIVMPLAGAFLTLMEKLFPRIPLSKTAGILSLGGGFYVLLLYLSPLLAGGEFSFVLGGWKGPIAIHQQLNGTAWLFLALVYTISFFTLLYTLKDNTYQKDFYFFYLILTAGLSGIILADDLFNTYVFLEIVGISAYILVAYLQKDKALFASYKYLFMGSLGGTLFLLGLFIIYKNTGSLSLEAVREFGTLTDLPKGERNLCLSALITGLGVKTAIIPFHTWLPRAHANSPHPVSAVLSGVVIKVSLFTLYRTSFLFDAANLPDLFLTLGAVTAILGAFFAFLQEDSKTLLAWSSVSQIGFILTALSSTSSLSLAGGFFHIINHALFKSLLFLVTGTLIQLRGFRSLEELRSLPKKSPLLAILFIIPAAGIIGIPPLGGYVSKKLILSGLGDNQVFYWVLWTASLGTAASFIKLSQAFLGPGKVQKTRLSESGDLNLSRTRLPLPYLLSLLSLALCSLIPSFIIPRVSQFLGLLISGSPLSFGTYLYTGKAIIESLGVLLLGFLIFLTSKIKPLKRFYAGIEGIHLSLDGAVTLLLVGFLFLGLTLL